jgi:hypothetical protein
MLQEWLVDTDSGCRDSVQHGFVSNGLSFTGADKPGLTLRGCGGISLGC